MIERIKKNIQKYRNKGKEGIVQKCVQEFYKGHEFKKAIRFAEQYKNIREVNKIIEILQKAYKKYQGEIQELLNQEQSSIDKQYNKLLLIRRNKNIFIVMHIVSLVITLFIEHYRIHRFHLLFLLGWLIGGIGAIIYKIILVIRNKYYSYSYKRFRDKADEINERYISNIVFYRNKVDTLYLDSLAPILKETILMRRDKERHHRDLINAQLKHQRLMEEEQRKIRQNQEELLKIEREKEERRKRNSSGIW